MKKRAPIYQKTKRIKVQKMDKNMSKNLNLQKKEQQTMTKAKTKTTANNLEKQYNEQETEI